MTTAVDESVLGNKSLLTLVLVQLFRFVQMKVVEGRIIGNHRTELHQTIVTHAKLKPEGSRCEGQGLAVLLPSS